ncbi:MAG TPA: hypothetical protein VEL79_12075 [Vicinamibacterales bacterium]|nr:hypothetical protein [Vicinamibacterales bacterium]
MSAYIASIVAHAAFWALLVCGWWLGELRWKGTAIFLTLWIAGSLVRPFVPNGVGLFSPFVAALDIGLVFTIFKGDVRLS